MNLAKDKQLQNFFFFCVCECVTFKCLFFPAQPVLLKQKHVFSWRGSLEAALLEWRAGAVEVMAAQVQASPGFWQELEFSLFRRGRGRRGRGGGEVVVDYGQFPSPAYIAQCFSVPALCEPARELCSPRSSRALLCAAFQPRPYLWSQLWGSVLVCFS